MAVDLSSFQGAFFEESQDHLATMEEGLLQLEQRPDDLDLLNQIFRAAHSIKGNAGMFGFTIVSEFTHKMENVLDSLRNSVMTVTQPLTDLLLESTDALKDLLEAVKNGDSPNEVRVGGLQERLKACLAAPTTTSVEPAKPSPDTTDGQAATAEVGRRLVEVLWKPAPTLFQRGLDPLAIIRELEALGDLTTTLEGLDRLPPVEELDPERCYLSWKFRLTTERPLNDIEGIFEFVRDDATLNITEVSGLGSRVSSSSPDVSGSGQDVSSFESGVSRSGKPETRDPRPETPDPETEAAPQPLGQILVEDGAISREALGHALAQQKRLGDILVEQKAASPEQVAKALGTQKKQEAVAQAKKVETPSIRVDIVKLDKLINLVGELVITQSMLSSATSGFDVGEHKALMDLVEHLERNTREIQERVMAVRMLPIGTTFNRFPRLVRDLATKNGKNIQLMLAGEETELDKTIIESIGDPLTHLVRNSADHGLESPEDRVASGKPVQGTIRLNAYHEGGNICLMVADDGRGLDREKILAKAVAQGLIAESDKLPDDQIWPLIFRPGFSTAQIVTDVSGRGVGMDVVKRNIEALGGTVAIRTAAGKGTTFTLKLPLTLAIVEGMTVRVGPEIYILPLITIVESIQPRPEIVKTVVGRGEVINVRGNFIPVVRLHEVFAIQPDTNDLTKAILVILETEGEQVAVMVDELVGQQQVVIKSLEQNFRKVEGIAGATILGDGTVGFILDVRGLLSIARQGQPVGAA